MESAQLYYLGLGSNINPALHLAQAIENLQQKFGLVVLWPVIQTKPEQITTSRSFLNTLIVIRTDLNQTTLKNYCNTLELAAGRDRSDPNRSQKDRPLDIDILAQQSTPDSAILQQLTEPYMQAVITSAGSGMLSSATTISLFGQRLGQRPAAIDTDDTGSHIVVIDDSVDSLLQRFETALFSE